jgi:hypothetical protein
MPRLLASITLVFVAGLGACRSFSPGGTAIEVRSLSSAATLKPALRTACYRRIDSNTADLYFSDIAESRLTDSADELSDAAGSILHIHYFLVPSPGNTPIDDTACNVTIRHVIFAPHSGASSGSDPAPHEPFQAFGIYGGGGFFYPSGEVGDATFGGSMHEGTHRLLHASQGFIDLLGPSAIDGDFEAVRDDGAAAAIQTRIDQFMRRTQASQPAPR